MNLAQTLSSASRLVYALFLSSRSFLPRQRSVTFDNSLDAPRAKIGPIYVINLDREPSRWIDILRELGQILNNRGLPLSSSVVRFSAYDAQETQLEIADDSIVLPFYTLGDQLFVEPQPDAMPEAFDLMRPIRMSRAEVAIASEFGNLAWPTSAVCFGPPPGTLLLRELGSAGAKPGGRSGSRT